MPDPTDDQQGAPPDDQGEEMELPGEDPDIEDAEDGGAYVRVATQIETPEFYSNLVDALPQVYLDRLALDYIERIERDKQAREKRDRQYEEGIKRTGLGNDAPGGATFAGASKVVHPMLTEACIDYSSRVIKELMPPDGPVKDKIVGKPTQDKVDRAHRKMQHMNYQLTEDMPEFREELEQCLTQVPLGGSQYIKLYYNPKLRRAQPETIYIDDMLLPFSATSFHSALRRTHVQHLTSHEFKGRIESGMYADVGDMPSPQAPDPTRAAQASDKIEGKADSGFNEDGLRDVFEIDCYDTIPDEYLSYLGKDVPEEPGASYPYLISIDAVSHKVCGFYRNWEEGDATCQRLDHAVEFPFIPWRGAYAIGLPHIIGGLSAAATGALRALLDSAHVNNSLTMVRLQQQNIQGQDVNPQVGQVSSVEAPISTNDIRAAALPIQFNPPSNVLFTLLGWLTEQAKGVVRTSLDNQAMDSSTNVPVGTQLSRVEQGLVVFNAVFARAHTAMKRLLKIQHRINRFNLPEEVRIDVKGDEILIYRQDYEGPMDVIPVSDPNIFSEQQRFAQMQAVLQRAMGNPLYNQMKVEERFLKGAKIPDYDELLNKPPTPKPMNAVNENVAASMGQPIVAFPTQNHLAHLQVHLDFVKDQHFGMNPLIAPVALGPLLENIKQHLAFWYLNTYYDVLSKAAGMPAEQLMSQDDPEVSGKFDELVAHASEMVMEHAGQAFTKVPPIITQAMQLLQQLKPPAPTDPAQAAIAAANIDAQGKEKIATIGAQSRLQAAAVSAGTAKLKLVSDQQNDQQRAQLDRERIQSEEARTAAEIGTKEAMNTQDNQTALQISEDEIKAGKHTNLKDGTAIGGHPSP